MGRNVKGCLFQRAKGRAYHVIYVLHGKRFDRALYREDGTPITNRKEAREKADFILLPLLARNEADRARAMRAAVETAEQAAGRAEKMLNEAREREERRKARERTEIGNCWRVYCQALRDSGRGGEGSDRPKPGTNRANYRGYCRSFAEWLKRRFFGRESVLLADVGEADARAYFAELRGRKSAGTVNKYLHFLRKFADIVFNACGLHDVANPFNAVETVGNARQRARRVLTGEQVETILEKAGGELKTLFYLGYFTGLRLGDCCTIVWDEIDLERRIITRTPRKTANSSGKTVKIGIPARLMEQLETAAENGKRAGYVLPDMARKYNLNRNNVCRPIKALFEACGLKNSNGYTEYGFHSLRHTFITRQAEAGTPIAVLQSLAGHSNPVMTEHYIGAISDEAARQYADRAFNGDEMRLASKPENENESIKKT